MPYTDAAQVLEYRDLNAVNADIEEGYRSFDDLLDMIRAKLLLPEDASDALTLRTALRKTERMPVHETDEKLAEEVALCRAHARMTLRLARCLIKDWVGDKD